MEQDMTTAMPQMDMGGAPQQKSGKGLKIATALMTIIALCGIGFGVFGMMQSQKKDDKASDLKVQIKNADGTTTALETPEITTTDGTTTVTITDTAKTTAAGGPYIEDGYFYVPEWGLKFNIPSDLANYGYSVNYDSAQVGYTLPSIGFTAMLKSDEIQGAQARYYDDIETCAIVNVSKEAGSWDTKMQINGIIKQFDDYALLIWNYSRHGSCDSNLHIDEVQEKIQTMFQNPEEI